MTMTETHSRSAAKPTVGLVDAQLRARFDREVAPLRDLLYRHALRISQNHADADDLVQDTMVKAYVSFDSFRSGTNVTAWLLRIMTNTYINGYRKKRRQPLHYSIEQITDQYLTEAHARSAASTLQSAEDCALESLPDNDVKAAMQALPGQFREAVYYADVEGLRYNEIASLMKTPRGTVMSRLHRGRRGLRALLGPAEAHVEPDTLPATA
jgi:RNA polymerase sigma-70 factor (ECF subfamily)